MKHYAATPQEFIEKLGKRFEPPTSTKGLYEWAVDEMGGWCWSYGFTASDLAYYVSTEIL